METIFVIVLVVLSIVTTLSITLLVLAQKQVTDLKNKKVNITDEDALVQASQIAKNKLLEAEKESLEIINKSQEEVRKSRESIKTQEHELNEREKKLLDRSKNLDVRFDQIEKKEQSLEQAKKDVKSVRSNLQTQLEKIAKLTKSEAEDILKQQVDAELNDWKAKRIRENKSAIEKESEENAKNILVEVMLNSATDYVAETTTTTLTIDDEALKGKIIGKDGRNIRTFEKLTGVDVIVDEAPNQVTISSFDPIRREVAALAMQSLLKDGRVHPGTIEETVEKVKKDLLKEIKKTGEEMAYETGFNDLPNEIIMLLGRFKYRFSYGQNLVKHTLEMVKIGEALANELNADVRTTKLACLLHDLGKVAPEEGKQHHHISGEIARKYFKGDDKLANAIEAHHFDIDSKFIEAEIVRIADAISGARPGARRDSYEEYVKRVRALEDIANKHKGVAEAYAVHAGREVRVVVKPDQLTDKDTEVLAHEIAKEIEETQNYPGVVKVIAIRETRVEEEAK